MASTSERILEAGDLRLRFFWRDDRYAHEIVLAARGTWHPLLRSIEGTARENWPPSPPLQSIDFERDAQNRQVALLLGMAGKSHWSASVELDPQAALARFSLACRTGGSDVWGPLSSRYEVLGSVQTADECRAIIRPAPPTSSGLRVDAQDHCGASARLVRSAASLTIEPHGVLPSDEPQTIQWHYAIAVDVA
jgi:hypothetical protein